ncbi:hypothetical protein MSC49_16960 [Methylosinus sp. C49]|jgi:hypothetical protein|uniref:hypothetical protein n=1 Tax=Methylosinus sp. C49 TaxID=2699395 RepID=UPI001366FC0B|nr:hypothetical protein [Methylosinus sp. C49]BBU61761.1 hypothetical protein MSC49_16960 [Methylosinus sp. C49]
MTRALGTRIRALMGELRLSPLAAMLLTSLAALDVAALAFALLAWIGPDDTASPAKSDWRPPSVLSSVSGPGPLAREDAQTLSRPIFWKSRRPRPIVAKSDREGFAGIPTAPAGLSLSAIVRAGASARAFVVSSDDPEGRWLTPGESVQGWTIAEVGELELKLVNGAQSARLQLYPAQSQ